MRVVNTSYTIFWDRRELCKYLINIRNIASRFRNIRDIQRTVKVSIVHITHSYRSRCYRHVTYWQQLCMLQKACKPSDIRVINANNFLARRTAVIAGKLCRKRVLVKIRNDVDPDSFRLFVCYRLDINLVQGLHFNAILSILNERKFRNKVC